MHKCFTFLLSLLCMTGLVKAQTGFQKLYDFSHNNSKYSQYGATIADFNKIIGIGYTNHDDSLGLIGAKNHTTFIASYDYNGNKLWEYKLRFTDSNFHSNDPSIKYNLIKRSHNVNVMCGRASHFLNDSLGTYTAFLYWFNDNGDSLDFASIPVIDNSMNWPTSIIADESNNILATGQYWNNPFGNDTTGIWVAKFTTSNQFLWKKAIIDTPYITTYSFATKIIEGNLTNQFLISGHAMPRDTLRYTQDVIWKIDSSGQVLWRKHIPKLFSWLTDAFSSTNDYFDIIKASNNSGYYFSTVAPRGTSIDDAKSIYYCGKLDEDGNIVWAKTYERRGTLIHDAPVGLLQKPNGDLLINGYTFNYGTNQGASTLLCTDSSGNVKWYKGYHYFENCTNQPLQTIYSHSLSPSGGIVRSGFMYQSDPQPDCWDSSGTYSLLVYTDSLGRLNPHDTVTIPIVAAPAQYGPVGIAEPEYHSKNEMLYPNPTTQQLNLMWKAGPAQFTLTDVAGRALLSKGIDNGLQQVDIRSLRPGIYFAFIRQNGKTIYQQKVVKN